MPSDHRAKHDPLMRSLALEMFEQGLGRNSVASTLGIPVDTVREWFYKYRAMGAEGVLLVGGKQKKYSYELKLEVVKAILEDGMSYSEAMQQYDIASRSPVQKWCRLYREGGEAALFPKPKGRPKGSKAKAKPMSENELLKERILRLEAENACLKKAQALRALRTSQTKRK